MSDLISSIGSGGGNIRRAQGPVAKPPVTAGAPAKTAGEAAGANKSEGFSPSVEAGETNQEAQVGEATASRILGAWSVPTSTAQSGQLAVQGLENTSVNQVHGVQNGTHVGSQGPQAGFSQGTVYSTRPPTG